MKIERVACQTHITALHHHRGKLFVGVGQDLEIYSVAASDQQQAKQPTKFRVFDCFSIAGISVYEAAGLFVVVHGDRFFSLYELLESHQTPGQISLRLVKDKINFCDWILEVQFQDGQIYGLLTSNRLAVFDPQTNRSKIIGCPEKFTLYAAKFLTGGPSSTHDQTEVNVAAGTVFSEILICAYSAVDCTIIERLTGHDGALFSIDYRPEMQLLATASDDRTVRLWSRASGRFVCTQVLYGHESRIWQVKLTSDCIISIGEISSLFFWSYDAAKCLFKERSKKISYWRLAVDEANRTMFYGASDGSIKQRSIDDAIRENVQVELVAENAKRFQFVEKENDAPHLIVTQTDGRVRAFATDHQTANQAVCELDFGQTFSNYNVLALEPDANRGVLGNIRGEVAWFELNSEPKRTIQTIAQKKIADHKLVNLFVVQHEEKQEKHEKNERELIACGPDGEVIVCSLSSLSSRCSSDEIRFKLPVFKYRQVNCVLKLSRIMIAFGDRSGNVIVYNKLEENQIKGDESAVAKRFVLIKLFKKVHSLVGGCKQLIRHPTKPKFYSCGRDGRVLEFDFDERRSNDDRKVDLLRLIKPSIEMDTISRIRFDAGGLLYVVGFRQNLLVVWNNDSQSIVWTVQASGSTKPWDFAISPTKLSFVCATKRDRLLYTSKPLDQTSLLRPKHHANTVLCGQPLFLKRRKFANKKFYFLTGCEDGELFVNSFDRTTERSAVEAVLHGHISNVRTTCVVEELLADCEDCEDIVGHCLVVTAGSASNLMAWDVRLRSNDQVQVKQLLNYFIWGPDRETMNLPWVKKPKQQLDSQLRFMDISLRKCKTDYLLCAVCSDASLRLFALSPSRCFFHLLGTYSLSGYCPLKLLDLGRYSLITSTDGSMRLVEFDLDALARRTAALVRNFPANPLAVLVNDSDESALDPNELERELRLVDTVRAHRFGINSIDSVAIEPEKVLVFSAGEDTSIGYTLISFERNGSEGTTNVRVLLNGSCPSKHCSMVSKVKVVGDDLLLTASWDQRIKIWQFGLSGSDLQLRWLRTIVSSIADISELLVFAGEPADERLQSSGEIHQIDCEIDRICDRVGEIHQEKVHLRQVTLVVVGEGEEIYRLDLSD